MQIGPVLAETAQGSGGSVAGGALEIVYIVNVSGRAAHRHLFRLVHQVQRLGIVGAEPAQGAHCSTAIAPRRTRTGRQLAIG